MGLLDAVAHVAARRGAVVRNRGFQRQLAAFALRRDAAACAPRAARAADEPPPGATSSTSGTRGPQ